MTPRCDCGVQDMADRFGYTHPTHAETCSSLPRNQPRALPELLVGDNFVRGVGLDIRWASPTLSLPGATVETVVRAAAQRLLQLQEWSVTDVTEIENAIGWLNMALIELEQAGM